jgi:hypothetical protein
LLHVGLRYARALLADDEDAEALYRTGLDADLSRWPFARARLQLAFGSWLRRRRRVAESRTLLRAARDVFDAQGAIPWAERARQELRAAGETSRQRQPDMRDLLTSQVTDRRAGSSGALNREIGQQLFLSHRTVSTHSPHLPQARRDRPPTCARRSLPTCPRAPSPRPATA